MSGTLYYGDNLPVLRKWIRDESVDLIYLDPPFNSKRMYNQIYKGSKEQERVFKDYWEWDDTAEAAYRSLTGAVSEAPRPLAALMRMFHDAVSGQTQEKRETLAYLSMMAVRLLALHRVLKPTGSLYLHCDPTASHYLKIVLDTIFGAENFRNEIIWKRTGSHNSADEFGPVHDTILFYAKSEAATCRPGTRQHSDKYLEHFGKVDPLTGKHFQDVTLTGPGVRKGPSGKPWRGYDPTKKNRHWQPASYIYDKYTSVTGKELAALDLLDRLEKLDEAGLIYWTKNGQPRYKQFLEDVEDQGAPLQDVWTDIAAINSQAAERLPYPTQKPIELLKRILSASSKPGDLVLDPFCGCGTTIEACEAMEREWRGIDIAPRAVDIIRDRMKKIGVDKLDVVGWPTDLDGAVKLAAEDKSGFQRWAVFAAGGRMPEDKIGKLYKGGGDGGIDGEIVCDDGGRRVRAIVSVKAGAINPDAVRALIGKVGNVNAFAGVFLTMQEPTRGMKDEARDAGYVTAADGRQVRRIQILTAEQLLRGERPDLPGKNVTPKSSPPAARKGENLSLPFGLKKTEPVKRKKVRGV